MKAMLLAAGRGERMRPLSDRIPKPLLEVGGKPLIAWQIERLAKGGFADLVINHAHLGSMIEDALGDGRRFGVRIRYSAEGQALETAGGIVNALPLLGDQPFAVISSDIYTEFDYGSLAPRLRALADGDEAIAHFVLTDNPPFHPQGDMGLIDGRVTLNPPRLNYGNIAVLHPRIFHGIHRGTKMKLFPPLFNYVEQGKISGEYYRGRWFNIGTPEQLAALDRLLKDESGMPI